MRASDQWCHTKLAKADEATLYFSCRSKRAGTFTLRVRSLPAILQSQSHSAVRPVSECMARICVCHLVFAADQLQHSHSTCAPRAAEHCLSEASQRDWASIQESANSTSVKKSCGSRISCNFAVEWTDAAQSTRKTSRWHADRRARAPYVPRGPVATILDVTMQIQLHFRTPRRLWQTSHDQYCRTLQTDGTAHDGVREIRVLNRRKHRT